MLGRSLHKEAIHKIRDPIGESERLSATLRFISSGDSQLSIYASYRMSATVIGRIIDETCSVIWDVLTEKGFVTPPSNVQEWRKISYSFEEKWNFSHALGAIDGKHIVMEAPARAGWDYFNYRKTHSIVPLAVCNADYEFLLVDIGDAVRQSDGSVYANSKLGHAIDKNLLNAPSPEKIRNSSDLFPYVFVGDDAFGLKVS